MSQFGSQKEKYVSSSCTESYKVKKTASLALSRRKYTLPYLYSTFPFMNSVLWIRIWIQEHVN